MRGPVGSSRHALSSQSPGVLHHNFKSRLLSHRFPLAFYHAPIPLNSHGGNPNRTKNELRRRPLEPPHDYNACTLELFQSVRLGAFVAKPEVPYKARLFLRLALRTARGETNQPTFCVIEGVRAFRVGAF